MKKGLIFIFALIAFQASAQNAVFYKYRANTVNSEFSRILESYVKSFSHTIQRSEFLDERAKLRTDYFLAVLEKKLNEDVTLSEVVHHIPHGSEGHHEQFGTPEYFPKPDSTKYLESLPRFTERHIIIDGEVMQQISWKINRKERVTDKKKLCSEELESLPAYLSTSIEKSLLESYENSPSHLRVIRNYGDGDYGMSTRIMVIEKQNSNGTWSYEMVLYNLVVFSSPI
jgi:hypothetical protein